MSSTWTTLLSRFGLNKKKQRASPECHAGGAAVAEAKQLDVEAASPEAERRLQPGASTWGRPPEESSAFAVPGVGPDDSNHGASPFATVLQAGSMGPRSTPERRGTSILATRPSAFGGLAAARSASVRFADNIPEEEGTPRRGNSSKPSRVRMHPTVDAADADAPLETAPSHTSGTSTAGESRAVAVLASKLISRDINYRSEFESLMDTFGPVFPRKCLENLLEQHGVSLPGNRQSMIETIYRAPEDPDKIDGVSLLKDLDRAAFRRLAVPGGGRAPSESSAGAKKGSVATVQMSDKSRIISLVSATLNEDKTFGINAGGDELTDAQHIQEVIEQIDLANIVIPVGTRARYVPATDDPDSFQVPVWSLRAMHKRKHDRERFLIGNDPDFRKLGQAGREALRKRLTRRSMFQQQEIIANAVVAAARAAVEPGARKAENTIQSAATSFCAARSATPLFGGAPNGGGDGGGGGSPSRLGAGGGGGGGGLPGSMPLRRGASLGGGVGGGGGRGSVASTVSGEVVMSAASAATLAAALPSSAAAAAGLSSAAVSIAGSVAGDVGGGYGGGGVTVVGGVLRPVSAAAEPGHGNGGAGQALGGGAGANSSISGGCDAAPTGALTPSHPARQQPHQEQQQQQPRHLPLGHLPPLASPPHPPDGPQRPPPWQEQQQQLGSSNRLSGEGPRSPQAARPSPELHFPHDTGSSASPRPPSQPQPHPAAQAQAGQEAAPRRSLEVEEEEGRALQGQAASREGSHGLLQRQPQQQQRQQQEGEESYGPRSMSGRRPVQRTEFVQAGGQSAADGQQEGPARRAAAAAVLEAENLVGRDSRPSSLPAAPPSLAAPASPSANDPAREGPSSGGGAAAAGSPARPLSSAAHQPPTTPPHTRMSASSRPASGRPSPGSHHDLLANAPRLDLAGPLTASGQAPVPSARVLSSGGGGGGGDGPGGSLHRRKSLLAATLHADHLSGSFSAPTAARKLELTLHAHGELEAEGSRNASQRAPHQSVELPLPGQAHDAEPPPRPRVSGSRPGSAFPTAPQGAARDKLAAG